MRPSYVWNPPTYYHSCRCGANQAYHLHKPVSGNLLRIASIHRVSSLLLSFKFWQRVQYGLGSLLAILLQRMQPRNSYKPGEYPRGHRGHAPPLPADKCTKLLWCKGDIRIKDNLRVWWPFFCSSLEFGPENWTSADMLTFFLLFTWLWAENGRFQISSPLPAFKFLGTLLTNICAVA